YSQVVTTHSAQNVGTVVIQDISQEADFEALRVLHASQATRLACDPWQLQSGDVEYLIEDSELRENYGLLIGEIAASHHLDIETVVEKFSSPHPPAAFHPGDWTVDPLKIACMLRVADAGHIDGARAPTFLLKLLEMNSISKLHWVAQNHLGRVMLNQNEPTQLIIASTKPFSKDEAAAWWVAFDAIALFDKELRDCNEVLAKAVTGTRQQFARKYVAGAGKVKELRKYVQTTDWEPTDTKVHVSDIASLIQKLGGEQLYSVQDKLEIVIRELIQNSSDAIAARHKVSGESFNKKIIVRLIRNSQSGGFVLQVDDDGIGMSQRTLTEDLMDFGKNFWRSMRASEEFPGIHASGFSSAGQFGIGFFSIFMVADNVKVYSRRFDKGLDSVKCLSFTNGLSLRPTLNSYRPEGFQMDLTTRVEIEFKQIHLQNPDEMNIQVNLHNQEGFCVPFHSYIAVLASGIPYQVLVEWDGKITQVHGGFPPKAEKRKEWLRALSYLNCGVENKAQYFIDRNAHRLREISDGNKCYGLAAINIAESTGCNFVTARAVGGLVSPHNRHDGAFIGLIDHFPESARRDVGKRVAPYEVMRNWLEEQSELIKRENLSIIDSIMASYSLSEFDFDPIEIFQGILVVSDKGPNYLRLDDLPQFLNEGNRLGFRVSALFRGLDNFGNQSPIPDICTCLVVSRGSFNNAELENGIPKNPNSLIGIVHRTLERKGISPKWITTPEVYNGPFGKCDCLEVTI
ncbi:MAG: ATP-binding protein, partial [Candidatus Poribacteria bacterium]|nr:ATP-binding protein [Candidatus Poribacteria bacterium]